MSAVVLTGPGGRVVAKGNAISVWAHSFSLWLPMTLFLTERFGALSFPGLSVYLHWRYGTRSVRGGMAGGAGQELPNLGWEEDRLLSALGPARAKQL